MKQREKKKDSYCGSGWLINSENLVCPLDGESRQEEKAEWFAIPADQQIIRTWCPACGGRHHDHNVRRMKNE